MLGLYSLITEYPNYFENLADDIGSARSLISKNIYSEGSEKYRGSKEDEISSRGVLGELIVRHYFDKTNIEASFSRIVAKKPIVGSDCITVFGGYDIKTVKKGATHLMINKDAHNNEEKRKDIDFYLFVILLGNQKANLLKIPCKDVDNWEEHKARYTLVYIKKIKHLI